MPNLSFSYPVIVIANGTGMKASKMKSIYEHSADGYMTAWFMYWLQGDEEAGKAFFGENAEIKTNENWQDVTVNIPQ